MLKFRFSRLSSALLLSMLLPLAAAGCGPSEADLSKHKTQGDRYLAQGLDPDGFSKTDIEKMNDREQYELFKKRYERMYEITGDVMTAATGTDQEWKVQSIGFVPKPGDRGQSPLPRGAKSEDTYTFSLRVFLKSDSTIDTRTVIEAIQSWMIEQGYNTSETGEGFGPPGTLKVDGLTQEGILVLFSAGETFMDMVVFAGPYWGDADKLIQLIDGPSDESLEEFKFILPYEHLPFPEFRGDSPYS